MPARNTRSDIVAGPEADADDSLVESEGDEIILARVEVGSRRVQRMEGSERTSAVAASKPLRAPRIDFLGARNDPRSQRSRGAAPHPAAPHPAAPHPEEGDRFDRLCDAFDDRLRSDGEELSGLCDQLAAETADAPTIVQQVQALSHRAAGAAALFGRKNIMHAASALEQAAIDALLPLPGCDRPRLLNAIRVLLDLLPSAAQSQSTF